MYLCIQSEEASVQECLIDAGYDFLNEIVKRDVSQLDCICQVTSKNDETLCRLSEIKVRT